MGSTGSTVSKTVQILLAERISKEMLKTSVDESPAKVYSRLLGELADFLEIGRPYLPRKLKTGSWTMDDLDKLADFFGKKPVDFIRSKP